MGLRGSLSETGVGLTIRWDGLTNGLRLSVSAVAERGGAVSRLRLGEEVSAERSGGPIKGAGLGLIAEAGRDTARMDLAGSSEAKGDGVIAGAETELMSEDSGNDVTPGVALRLISGVTRDGVILRFESEAT